MMRFLDARYFSLPFSMRLVIALAAVLVIGLIAYRKRQLNLSGVVAAVVMGAAATVMGGFTSLSLYLFFLISAAVIGKLSKRIRGLDRIHKKGGRRDAVQVLANGGAALAAMLIHAFDSNPVYLAVFTACLAEACSDTWASEIGVLSKSEPVSILTFTKVPKGLSGGVSLLGTCSAMLSSILYGIFAFSCYDGINLSLVMVVIFSSFAGVMTDSVLGATLQAHFYDEKEDIITEHSRDREGNALKLVRGLRFMDNDMVNLTSNIITFLLASLFGFLTV